MNKNREHGVPARLDWRWLLAVFVAVVLGAGAPHAVNGVMDRRHSQERLEIMAFELIALQGRIAAKQVEVEDEIALAEHLLGWILGVEIGGSAELLRGFEEISGRPEPVRAPWLDGVVAAGAPELRRDLSLWGSLASFRSELAAAEQTGIDAHRAYVRELDLRLEDAVWASVFGIGPELAPVLYGEALRGLKESDFPGVLRHQLRGMKARAGALREVAERMDALIRAMEAAR